MVTIRRGAADIMVAGATGTRVHPMKTVHALQNEQVALGGDGVEPTRWSRPFDQGRTGMVLGEGSAVLVLEELGHALARGARIHGEVLGHAARAAVDRGGTGRRRPAMAAAMRRALGMSGIAPAALGHVHAHGVSTVVGDRDEAAAMHDVLGADASRLPTVAAKSHFGNLGAASGLVECIASLQACAHGALFPVLNYETPDPACDIRAARGGESPGDVFLTTSVTPQGQAASLVVRRWTDG